MPVAVAVQVELVHECGWFWNFVRCVHLSTNCIECRPLPTQRHRDLYQQLTLEAMYQ